MAKLIDLTGATVTIPSGWNAPEGYGHFYIKGSANGTAINKFEIGYYTELYTLSRRANNLCFTMSNYINGWLNITPETTVTLTITEGTDVTNPDLIDWFVDNDATIEGGVWKEVNIQITTKESIVLEMAGTKCEQDIEIIVEQEELPVWDGTVEDYVSKKIIYVYDVFSKNTFTFNVGNASTYGDITFPCYDVGGSRYLKTALNGGLGIYLYGPQANDNVYHIYTGSLSDEVEFTDSIENGVTLYCTGAHSGGTNE